MNYLIGAIVGILLVYFMGPVGFVVLGVLIALVYFGNRSGPDKSSQDADQRR